MGIAFGILAGVGVLMVAMSLFATPLPAASNGLAQRLDALSPSLFGDEARQARPLLDRLVEFMFGASGARLGAALNRRQADEIRLKLAGWPKPYTSVESLYTYKVAISIWMGLIGLVLGILVSLLMVETGPVVIPFAAVLAVVGFFVPDLAVSGAARKRREQTISEMSSALGRLAIFVAAGNRLPVAVREVGSRPGGPFIHELRQVAADYTVSADLAGALDAMAERYPLPEIVAFAGRMRVALEQGGSVAPALRAMAQDAREKLNLLLEERAGRNTLLMILPLGMVITTALAILIGPGAAVAIQMFSGSGGF